MTNPQGWDSILNPIPILRALLQSIGSFLGLLSVPVKRTAVEEEEREREADEVTYRDIGVVLQRLGMAGIWREEGGDGGGGGGGGMLVEGVGELLEEKTASLEELEEAFYVFDRNEDGFISHEELWAVMRRLGLRTVSLRDCERMIRVYDDDEDGKISFSEFRNLLESAS